MSRQQEQQQPRNNNNAWAQGSGWDRVTANVPLKEKEDTQKPAGVRPNSSTTATSNQVKNQKTKNHNSINGNKNASNHAKNNNNNNSTTTNNSNKKDKSIKPDFVMGKPGNNNKNSNIKSMSKKNLKRSANESESRSKPITQQPFVLLKSTDFPALQASAHPVPPTPMKPVVTKLDASAPSFPAVVSQATTPAVTSNKSITTPPSFKQNTLKPPKPMASSGQKPTKAPTLPQKQKTLPAASSTKALTSKQNSIAQQAHDLPQGQEHALLRLMQQGKMVVNQKGRQRIRPRRKKFSALKKKVLEERLRQWRARNEKDEDGTNNDDETKSTTLAVLGWLTSDDDWNDDDEYQELCSNFQEMAEKMGPVQWIWIPRREDGPVYVQFQDPQIAEEALHAWNGLSLGGTVLQVMPLTLSSEEVEVEECSDEENAWRSRCEQAFQKRQSSSIQIDTVHEIGLWNALTEDDLEDDECLEESVNDIRVLSTSYGPLETVRVEREGTPRVVLVYTCNLQEAKRIASQLNQVTLSGTQLLAKVLCENDPSLETPDSEFIVVLRNVLTAEDLEDEECLEESMADIQELAKQFGVVEKVDADVEAQTISVHYTYADGKEKARTGFHGMIIGGQTISVSNISVSDDAAVEPGNNNNDEEATEPMFSGDKRIPERFAECKRVPKVPNSGHPRHYSIISENETVKPLLIEMLAELMRLQKRAVEDKNAKAKRRLVMGLREVARGIRARKVRMVVMANNLDEYGALDEKLQEILDLARREEVPVFFEFSKRALGKAIGKTIKIAVIGIQNPDGANQQFKKLSVLAAPIPVQAS